MTFTEGLSAIEKTHEIAKKLEAERALRAGRAWESHPKRFEIKKPETGFYTTYEERIKHVPAEISQLGEWKGKRGESVFRPSTYTAEGKAAKETLAKKGLDGIRYRDGEPDFSKCAEATVRIDKMTVNRAGNFSQADVKCAEQWNRLQKDGKSDWTARDIRQWRDAHNCSWHERCDTKTMDLVPREIHGYFTHSGGIAECRARDTAGIGGIFDA